MPHRSHLSRDNQEQFDKGAIGVARISYQFIFLPLIVIEDASVATVAPLATKRVRSCERFDEETRETRHAFRIEHRLNVSRRRRQSSIRGRQAATGDTN